MAVWDELKEILARLRDEEPGVLQSYPDPGHDEGREPPFEISLAPWAIATAEDLHNRFGQQVSLVLGALAYPPGSQTQRPHATSRPDPLISPREAAVALDGPAVVRSGHTLRHGLLLRNLTRAELQVATNGQVTAVIVDPATGDVVGGFAGAQALPLVMFLVAPAGTGRIPLLIGTASFTPRLGYAVPGGSWGLQATLTLGPDPRTSLRRRTPVLPLTITA